MAKKFCSSCGESLPEGAVFCENCGAKVDGTNTPTNPHHNDFKDKLPLIIAILAVVIGIAETLSTPMLMGVWSIMYALLLVIAGGLAGIYLLHYKKEYLIAACDFILVAILMYLFISGFAQISAILFFIAAILTIYLKGRAVNNKKMWLIPIAVVIVLALILMVAMSVIGTNNANSITISDVSSNIVNDYGYYNGDIQGDISTDAYFADLEVKVNFLDVDGRILSENYALSQSSPEAGQVYHFSTSYFDEIKPVTAEILVYDDILAEEPIYTENVTL